MNNIRLSDISGNLYNAELLYNIQDKVLSDKLFGYMVSSNNVKSEKIFIVKNIKIDDDIIYGDITILKNEDANKFVDLILKGKYFYLSYVPIYNVEKTSLINIDYLTVYECKDIYRGVQLYEQLFFERKQKILKLKNKLNVNG